MALFLGLLRWAGTRKAKPIWILLKQETVSVSGISWAIRKSATRSRQTTTPAPHHSVFTCRMPFLSPNQQRQSTEGKKHWTQKALTYKVGNKAVYCRLVKINSFRNKQRKAHSSMMMYSESSVSMTSFTPIMHGYKLNTGSTVQTHQPTIAQHSK